ncbi:hypothetical protein ONZ43_g6975 [Nemania bipapillata]|uniref:Uncharacterized protein n=1 Tax=Nemania bipapillata TaxID=110536 RepID=A0ACC2HUE8_9PEZI|nr:hypothetical protein ONZ43_g6975 [Nemania bipapillata]
MAVQDIENVSVVESAAAKDSDAKGGDTIHEFKEAVGYEVDVASAEGDDTVKLAGDGRTRLIPQPSEDPADPLNWSQFKKNLILFLVAFAALLPDYGSATGAVTLIPQAQQWNMSEDEVNHSQAGNVFVLGAGGIFGTYSQNSQPQNTNMAHGPETVMSGVLTNDGVVS